MKKIIVAGAGHGGVAAAALLAREGYEVTVYEKSSKAEIGYDFPDTFELSGFDDAEIEYPPASKCKRAYTTCFVNPSNTVSILMPDESETNVHMERKYLINYLIRHAKAKGASFRYGCTAVCPITVGTSVKGIVYEKDGKLYAAQADLVIDAAGMRSPVRRNLPSQAGITPRLDDSEIFTVYRAIFERTDAAPPEHEYYVHMFHMSKPGLSWLIVTPEGCDILIGRFGNELSDRDIEDALDDLRRSYSVIGYKLLRGGTVEKIPLRKTLPLIVADGYAAIGDSAAMTIPLIGSGISNSLRAAKYLADAVIACGENEPSRQALWRYQYEYFTNVGNKLVMVDKAKRLATLLSGSDVDYLMEKEIMTQNEISMAGDKADRGALPLSSIVQKVIKVLPKAGMVSSAARTFANAPSIKRVLAGMPKEYDEEAVSAWIKKYEAL